MQFNLTTFLLEIANFLVLVWLLKRFFYRPVRNMIELRRANIQTQMAEAGTKMQEAERLQKQYEMRLVAWDEEKRQARAQLQDDVNKERTHQLDAIGELVNQEREKAKVLVAREFAENSLRSQTQALAQAARFSTRLITQIATDETESRLLDLFCEQFPRMSADYLETLKNNYRSDTSPVKVTTAYPVADDRRVIIQELLSKTVGVTTGCIFSVDSQLIAGIRLNIGALVVRANLQDELQYFSDAVHAED